MRHRSARALAMVCTMALGVTVNACPQGAADDGLELRDASQGCAGSESLSRPFAVGSRLDMEVGQAGVGVAEVVVERPDIWSVEAIGNPVALRAAAAGESLVTIRSEDGRVGTVTLEAAPASRARLASWPGIQPFNIRSDLDNGTFDLAAHVASRGYALLPDGALRLEVVFEDDAGRELGGYDVARWTVEPEAAAILSPAESGSDAVIVTHAGGAANDVLIRTIAGGEFELSLVDSGAGDTMELLAVDRGKLTSSVQLTEGATETFVALAYDERGRWLVGTDDSPLSITLENDGAVTVAPPPWSEGENGIELDAELEQLLRDQAAFYLRGLSPGQTTIVVEVAGLSQEFSVDVVAAP